MDNILEKLINSINIPLNVCNLNPTGLVLLLLSNDIIMNGQDRIDSIKWLINNRDIDFQKNITYKENPLLLAGILGLNENILNQHQLYELLSVIMLTNININQYYDAVEDVQYGLPIDLIFLNPHIDGLYKQKIIKLFVNNGYDICKQYYDVNNGHIIFTDDNNIPTYKQMLNNIKIPNILVRILCYDNICVCHYNGELCNYCINGWTNKYNVEERYVLADHILKYYCDNEYVISTFDIVYSILESLNIGNTFPALKFAVTRNLISKFGYHTCGNYNKNMYFDSMMSKYSFGLIANKFAKYDIQIKNIFILLLDVSINNGTYNQFGVHNEFMDKRNMFIDHIVNISNVYPKYVSLCIEEIFLLLCIAKHGKFKNIIKYKIIPYLII